MYVAIGPLHTSRHNISQNNLVEGLASPSAFLGFANIFARAADIYDWAVSCLTVIHSYEDLRQQLRPEFELKGKALKNAEIPEKKLGTMSFSVILKLPEAVDLNTIEACLLRARLAGSSLFWSKDARTPIVREVSGSGTDFLDMPRGYVYTAAPQPVVSFGDDDALEVLAQRLSYVPGVRGEKPGKGFIVPVAAGYRLLTTDVGPKFALRNPDMPHHFAEPAVSVGELISIRNPRVSQCGSEEFDRLAWQWQYTNSHIYFHPDFSKG